MEQSGSETEVNSAGDDAERVSEDSVNALSDSVSKDRATRFYDRLRATFSSYLSRKGSALGTVGEFLFFVPDVFILLWRLTNDKRVEGKNKVLLGTGLAYYIFPLDIIPEALLGPTGFIDDLVLAAYILNRVMADTDVEVLRQHWSGSGDVLDVIRKVLSSADSLVPTDFLAKIKKIVK